MRGREPAAGARRSHATEMPLQLARAWRRCGLWPRRKGRLLDPRLVNRHRRHCAGHDGPACRYPSRETPRHCVHELLKVLVLAHDRPRLTLLGLGIATITGVGLTLSQGAQTTHVLGYSCAWLEWGLDASAVRY